MSVTHWSASSDLVSCKGTQLVCSKTSLQYKLNYSEKGRSSDFLQKHTPNMSKKTNVYHIDMQ